MICTITWQNLCLWIFMLWIDLFFGLPASTRSGRWWRSRGGRGTRHSWMRPRMSTRTRCPSNLWPYSRRARSSPPKLGPDRWPDWKQCQRRKSRRIQMQLKPKTHMKSKWIGYIRSLSCEIQQHPIDKRFALSAHKVMMGFPTSSICQAYFHDMPHFR